MLLCFAASPDILAFANEKFDRQSLAGDTARGKSGLHRAGCWITSSQRELKDSATEMDRRWRCMAYRQGWNRGVRDHEEVW